MTRPLITGQADTCSPGLGPTYHDDDLQIVGGSEEATRHRPGTNQ